MSCLIRLSIHPVQQYIAEARRVRDLINGSQLLSATMGEVAELARQRAGVQVLIPAVHSEGADPPNVVVLLTDSDGKRARSLAEELAAGARQHWAAELGSWLGPQMAKRFTITTEQLEQVLEVRWVAVEREPGESLVASLERLGQLYGSRRLVHPFAAATGADGAINCTQCGRRNALTRGADSAKISWLRSDFRFRPNEMLCASCAAKRTRDTAAVRQDAESANGRRRSLPSTRDIALAPMKAAIREGSELTVECEALLGNVLTAAAADGLDCQGLEPSLDRISASLFAEGELAEVFTHNIGPDGLLDRPAEQTRQAQAALFAWLEQQALPVSDWFAVLLADGDRMGSWFSGRCRPELRQHDQLYLDHQRTLGHAVQRAAAEIRSVIEEQHHGSVVYSGGDDVMALLPAVNAFGCVVEVRKTFRKAFADLHDKQGSQPTLSAGLCLAHVKEPLRLVLARAREAEHEAKEVWGRDALVVSTLLPSGTQCSVGGKWQTEDEHDATPVAELLDQLVSRRRQGHLSGGFFPDLCAVLPACWHHNQGSRQIDDTGRAMVEALTRRLLRRRRPDEHRSTFPDHEIDRLACAIASLTRGTPAIAAGVDHLQNLTGLLHSAAVILRKEV